MIVWAKKIADPEIRDLNGLITWMVNPHKQNRLVWATIELFCYDAAWARKLACFFSHGLKLLPEAY